MQADRSSPFPLRRTLFTLAAGAALLAGCVPQPWAAAAAETAEPAPVQRFISEPVTTAQQTPAPRQPELIADKVIDAGIGTAVSAELARDDALASSPVEVDCVGGHVALRGTAPDLEARERATRIASAVEGVRVVENVLEVATAEGAMR